MKVQPKNFLFREHILTAYPDAKRLILKFRIEETMYHDTQEFHIDVNLNVSDTKVKDELDRIDKFYVDDTFLEQVPDVIDHDLVFLEPKDWTSNYSE